MSQETRAAQLVQDLDVEPARLTESYGYDSEGTTYHPIIEYIDEDEHIKFIFTAKMSVVGVNGSSGGWVEGGRPTYVFTDKNILGIIPIKRDEILKISYEVIDDIKTTSLDNGHPEIIIKTYDRDEYKIPINSSQNCKENIIKAKKYVTKNTISRAKYKEKYNPINKIDERNMFGDPQWRFHRMEGLSAPTLKNDSIYVRCRDNHLYILDSNSGKEKMSHKLENEIKITDQSKISEGAIYSVMKKGDLYAIDINDQTKKWEYSEHNISDYTVRKDTVFAINANKQTVHAIECGNERWSFSCKSISVGDSDESTVYMSGITESYMDKNVKLFAVDIETGNEEWTLELNNSDGITSPTISDNTIYVGDSDYLYAINKNNSDIIWKCKVNLLPYKMKKPSITNKTVYIGNSDGGLYAINKNTGSIKWIYESRYPALSQEIVDGTIYSVNSPPQSNSSNLYCSYLHEIEADSGNPLSKTEIEDTLINEIAVDNKRVYFTTQSGYLNALVRRHKKKAEKEKLYDDIESISSKISNIDALVSDSKLDKADTKLSDIESEFGTVKQKASEYNIDEINKVGELINVKMQNIQNKKAKKRQKKNSKDDIQSIRSKISNIDDLISNSKLDEADTKLSDTESEFDTLDLKAFDSDVDVNGIEELRESITKKRRILNKKRKEEKIRRDIQSIRSKISNVESFVSDSKFDKADTKLSDIEARFDRVKRKASDYDIDDLDDLVDLINKERKKIQEEKQKKIQSIRSELSNIDSLISERDFQEADSQLDDISSQLDAIEERTSCEIEGVEEIRRIICKKKQKIDSKNEGEEIQEEIHHLRSDLNSIDDHITDAEFQQAEEMVETIKSNISSLRIEISDNNFDDIQNELSTLRQDCENRLSKSHVLSQLRGMDPYEFEELVAKLWKKRGWNAEATSGSTDRGIDVIATKEDTFEKRRHLIQVKRHGENSRVGSEAIQRYASLYQRDEQVDKVFIVTSNRFTSEAKEVAEGRDVSVINRDKLYEMLTET